MSNTTSSIASTVVSLNSESLHSLRSGNYREASQILLKALELIKSKIQPKPAPTKIRIEVDLSNAPVRGFPIDSVDILSHTPKIAASAGQNDLLLSFYPRAFAVPYTPITKNEKATALMVCIYNLGLARHLESLKASNSALSRTLQAQAAKLYESALKVASMHMKEDSFKGVQGLVLAVTNNYAHVLAEHFDMQEAGRCVSMMKSILSDPSALRDLPEADYSFFEMNVITFLEAPLLSAAPAA